ncbi:hypothetical protein PSTG_02717 [Puccinia striiformis f. sp. tritici PST-78]|uniref:Tc1-like transposase DDE domain-containing protein n=1 Tax=Puccinia striiformis f. sp. tritici PST-78 TaxID=1165861 RepID=A0A0L0VXM7_9BASI|nr:hypothetical protein PSTG_02717 [Puccinia striiformis f. sp. tritici PST-78]
MSESAVMDSTKLEIEANKEQSRALVKELRDLTKATAQKEAIKKAKGKERKANTIIKPEVHQLIRDNVNGKGRKIADAMKAHNVSQHQIQHIKAEDPDAVTTRKKRPSKFTEDMKTKLLLELDQKSTTTLPEMAKFIHDEFNVKVSTQAISNLTHDMDISWKQDTDIPVAWNHTDLIEQRATLPQLTGRTCRSDESSDRPVRPVSGHGCPTRRRTILSDRANFVNRRGLGLGQRLVFTDEAGFDLHYGQGFGYAPSGMSTGCSQPCPQSQAGHLLVDSFNHYELLNADNTKAKGVGADEVCLFLGILDARLPRESIIIMDNSPTHQGKHFHYRKIGSNKPQEVISSLKASKLIKIEFLPPYSPFLNPIEYSFHSIKSSVWLKQPPNGAALVEEIKHAVDKAITPKKSKKFFSHCQQLYRPCAEFQQITGAVLLAPPDD